MKEVLIGALCCVFFFIKLYSTDVPVNVVGAHNGFKH